jgi:very-short-patch-repair endonuclease
MPRTAGWPTHYKLDLANPETHLAIEIDGHCHDAITRQEQDRRKMAFLAERGWCVLRITNERALWLSTTCTSPDILRTSLMGFLSTIAI